MKKFEIVVAFERKLGIGKDNVIPWKCSEDIQNFKRITTGNIVIMGRNTFESLPNGGLPNRENVVITRNTKIKGVACFKSLDEALQAYNQDSRKVFVIGGGQLYKEAVKHGSFKNLHVTFIKEDHDCDVKFPELPINRYVPITVEKLTENAIYVNCIKKNKLSDKDNDKLRMLQSMLK